MPASLRRFLQARAPRCEWPGCGTRAVGCDQDHDLAWPHGPTCACNLGPLCRRHHRIKQLGWVKLRTAEGVRWTAPTGRSWVSPAQHHRDDPAGASGRTDTPARRDEGDPRRDEGGPTQMAGRFREPGPLDELSPLALEHELWALDPTDAYVDGLDQPGDLDAVAACHTDELHTDEVHWAADLAALRRWSDACG